MSCTLHINHRALVLAQVVIILALASRLIQADTGTCNGAMTTLPFTDVSSSNIFFCAIAQAYFSGLTNGTSATTYAPTQNVPREQMAAFITRTQDSALKRGSRRAALEQWWTPSTPGALRSTDLGDNSFLLGMVCDGEDVWVTFASGSVKRVRASDGKLLQTWTGADGAGGGIIAAAGRIFITGGPPDQASPGKIYVIDPLATPGAVSVFANDIGLGPNQITFDGTNLWTSNVASATGAGSISRVNVSTGIDSTFTAGFDGPLDILWDGANLWVLDYTDGQLKRVDPSNGTVLESTPIIQQPGNLLFDGTNIWVSGGRNTPNNISVVRAVGGLRGTVLATLNAGSDARGMAFDGERVMVCNYDANSVFLFKAADFTPLGTVSTGAVTRPVRACSDGLHFWIGRFNSGLILRF